MSDTIGRDPRVERKGKRSVEQSWLSRTAVLGLCFVMILLATGLMPDMWTPQWWTAEVACVVLAATLAGMAEKAR